MPFEFHQFLQFLKQPILMLYHSTEELFGFDKKQNGVATSSYKTSTIEGSSY
jgi:hypothetical protein